MTFGVAVVAAVIGVILGIAINRFLIKDRTSRARDDADRIVQDAEKQAETLKKEALLEAKDQIFKMKGEAETEQHRRETERDQSRLGRRERDIEQCASRDDEGAQKE